MALDEDRKPQSEFVADTFRKAFHKHLDQCKRCRENCFDLCSEGSLLLRCAADTATTHMLSTMPRFP